MDFRLAYITEGEVNWCEELGTVLANDEIVNGVSERGGYPVSKKRVKLQKLVDKNIIDHNILYGSWAGAFGNFQFMPTTIKKYAIDYDKNEIIELKSTKDSFASAANYINKLGWNPDEPCYLQVELMDNVPKSLLTAVITILYLFPYLIEVNNTSSLKFSNV